MFGSGFLAHQGAISEIQGTEQVDPMDMMEQVTKGLDNRMEFYQQINVTMDMQVVNIIIFLNMIVFFSRQMFLNLSKLKTRLKTAWRKVFQLDFQIHR